MVVQFSQQIDESEEDSSDVTSDQSSRIITHGSNLNDQSHHFGDIQEDKLKTNETIKKSQAKNKGAAKVDKNKKKYAEINDATQNESQFMGLITDTNLPFDVLNSKETEQDAKKKKDDRYQVDIFENEAPEDGLQINSASNKIVKNIIKKKRAGTQKDNKSKSKGKIHKRGS